MKRAFAVTLCLAALVAGPIQRAGAASGATLADAMKNKDLAEIQRLTAEAIQQRGTNAGVPDAEPEFRPVPKTATPLRAAEIKTAFQPYVRRLQRERWWREPQPPQEMDQPLRAVASVVEGCLAAHVAGCADPEALLQMARAAGEVLLWAQTNGGRGVFPVPAWKGKRGRLGELSDRFLERAEKAGRLAALTQNGWIVDDTGSGDLQFDNGVSGVAVLHLFETTREQRYLRSARAAADWASRQPVVPNWNYNSFSVFLLSEVFRVTKDHRYLDAAREKVQLGIYPGQLKSGPQAGRWFDPHNARLVYHFILLRGLAAYAAVLPADDPDLAVAKQALQQGVSAWLPEVTTRGVANGETVLEFLARVQASDRLRPLLSSQTEAAWELLGRLYSAQVRTGGVPVAPGAWGIYLQSLKLAHGAGSDSP